VFCDDQNNLNTLGERERNHYDAYAEDDITCNFFNSFIHTIIFDRYLKHIPDSYFDNKVVLDLCCGFSRLLRYATHKGCQNAIGVDISFKMLMRGIKEKKMWVYTCKLPYKAKINFIQGTMENIPLKESVVDMAFITAAFHHLPDKEGFIHEAKKLIKPGGLFIIRDPNGSHYLRKLGNKVGKRWGTLSDDEESIGFAEVSKLLSQAGFQVQKVVFFNLFAEINSHLSEIVYKKFSLLGRLQRAFNILLYPIEILLDKTLLRICPNLGWCYLIISRSSK